MRLKERQSEADTHRAVGLAFGEFAKAEPYNETTARAYDRALVELRAARNIYRDLAEAWARRARVLLAVAAGLVLAALLLAVIV
jgi:hypothetical protein